MCPDLFLEEVPHLPCGSIGWSLTGGSTVIRRLESVAKLSLQVTDKKVHNGKYPGSQTLRVVMNVKGSEDPRKLDLVSKRRFCRC